MNIKGFSITDSKKSFPTQDHYCMAYHDRNSATWSWIIWWTPPWRSKNRTNMNSLKNKLLGSIYFKKQDKVFYKE